MPLPKIDVPTFNTILPSSNKKIRYRAFTVKEEKLLLSSVTDTSEEQDQIDSAKQIVNNCVITDNFDVEKVPFFDFEFLFLLIRAKSVGEVVELRYRHTEDDCDRINDVKIDLNNVKLSEKPSDGKINLSSNFGIKLRYPTIDEVAAYENQSLSKVFDLIKDLVEYVYDSESVYQPDEDYSEEELAEWIERLSKDQSKKLINFVSEMPRVYTKVNFKCSKCEKPLEIEVRGLKDFFL